MGSIDFFSLYKKPFLLFKTWLQKNANLPYAILKTISHHRINSQHLDKEEIFDLYRLGIFNAPDSILGAIVGMNNNNETIQEVVELVELQPQATYRPHYHKNSAAIIYIVSGSGIFLLGKQEIVFSPGMRIPIPPGVMHGFKTEARTLFLSIQSPSILNAHDGSIDLHY